MCRHPCLPPLPRRNWYDARRRGRAAVSSIHVVRLAAWRTLPKQTRDRDRRRGKEEIEETRSASSVSDGVALKPTWCVWNTIDTSLLPSAISGLENGLQGIYTDIGTAQYNDHVLITVAFRCFQQGCQRDSCRAFDQHMMRFQAQ